MCDILILSLERKDGETMSDTKPEKVKRGYRMDGGKALSYDLRVRLDAETAERLARYAARHKTTRAAAARSILQSALDGPKT